MSSPRFPILTSNARSHTAHPQTTILAALGSLVLTAACSSGTPFEDDALALLDGTAEGVGVLRLLNAQQVGFKTLDLDASLDRRAAANLIAHRDGPDSFYGTADDNGFDSLDEVDAVKFVGPSAMNKLALFADVAGFVPGPDEILGSFDGVAFTVAEAEQALVLCNEESEGVLDVEIGLDSRAVESILSARSAQPIATVIELADLYFVGPSALRALRDTVARPRVRADCRNDTECSVSERCQGIPFDGSSDFGKCRPRGNVPGVGNDCSPANPCGPGLFCGGLTFGGGGMCIADWQQDTFENTTQRFIPLETPVPVATAVVVRGQATVPFDITVDVELTHDDPHSLRIALFDPNGTDAVLWDGPNEGGAPFPGSFIALGNISRDDTVNGRWFLRVESVAQGGVGNLDGWTLWLSSNFD